MSDAPSTLKARLRARRRSKYSLGCAGVLVALGAVLAFMGWGGHQLYLQRQEQIPRLLRVRATVQDKGIQRREWWTRDAKGSLTTRTEEMKWIRFTCLVGEGSGREGTRESLSGYERRWDVFERGAEYDAYFDPVTQECFLVVDEEMGGLDARFVNYLLFGGLLLALGIALPIVSSRLARRPASLPD